jgi:hypothetical protein
MCGQNGEDCCPYTEPFADTLPRGLMPRIDHGHIGHPWASRDWQDIDCSAPCTFNRNGKCSVPSLAEIGDDGRCKGFQAKLATGKE